ncbi:hypothetical protein UFOVP826_28 [uncultured Caudovirales phage]|uniref:Uncharacterized protein n=1 Tax=uncultured Caudovirales phage TaxID=2100421 RepID=A0A6J5P4V4_9CAUD|nr:hypothetical protein UFOVP826_28 [uncultured Caudovirales phage]
MKEEEVSIKVTMTVKEFRAMEEMAAEHDLSYSGMMRYCLRHYQSAYKKPAS